MSSTQRLQDYIDSLKAARLSGGAISPTPNDGNTSSSTPFRHEPRDMLELEFMDSLDARMQQMERNLSHHSNHQNSSSMYNNQNPYNSIVTPAPNNFYNSSSLGGNGAISGSTLLQKLLLQQQQQQNQSSSSSSSLQQQQQQQRRNFMWNSPSSLSNLYNGNSLSAAARHNSSSNASSLPLSSTSLVFRVTLPFLRSTIGTISAAPSKSAANSECATFVVHVADLSQTGDDLLWHVIAQARIRFPDLMQVGGFEWTPGAASSLVLFALAQEEANFWVDSDQSKGGSARAGGAFLHYDSATPLFRYQPINKAIRKREQALRDQQNSSNNANRVTEAMSRSIRGLGPEIDVELFVLMKTMVPQYELTQETMKRQLVV